MEDHRLYSDKELLHQIKSGNSAAYTEIFNRYNGILYRHAFRFLNDHDEVEDVIQDTFLTLWQKREELTIKTSFSSYLYSTVRNRILNRVAHRKVAARYADSLNEFLQAGRCITDERIREHELATVIQQEVAALPPKMRKVFLLSRKNEYSYKEIGEQLEISEKTVRNQVYNAVQILKAKISSSFLSIFL